MNRTIDIRRLRKVIIQMFEKAQIEKDVYRPTVDGLLETSLRGVDSHGIRLVPHYIRASLLGRINPQPKYKIKKTSPTTIVLDADNTFGITASVKAMENAIAMAKKSGTGIVVVKNSSHFGAAGIYGLMAAKKNMIGYAFTNVDSLVVPYGGKSRFLGTNAFCFAAPMAGESPFCLDMATTTISWNKLMIYQRQNKPLEKGWAVDAYGRPTTDPHKVFALTHFGSYKGYGVALMIEMMTSLLTGMPYGPHIPHMFPVNKNCRKLSHFFMAIDIKRFQTISTYKNRMTQFAEEIRESSSAEGFENVMVSGDPEKKMYKERKMNGIPMAQEVYDDYMGLMNELKLEIKL